VRIFIALGFICFLATACNRHSAQLRQQVAGTWAQGPHTLTLGPDGSYTSVFPGKPPVTYKARWRIEGDLMLVTDVRSNSVPIAGDTSVKIVSVDKHRLEMELAGNRISMRR